MQEMKQVKQEPVSLPNKIEDIRHDSKYRKNYQMQAVMFGVDILKNEMDVYYDLNKTKETKESKSLKSKSVTSYEENQQYF